MYDVFCLPKNTECVSHFSNLELQHVFYFKTTSQVNLRWLLGWYDLSCRFYFILSDVVYQKIYKKHLNIDWFFISLVAKYIVVKWFRNNVYILWSCRKVLLTKYKKISYIKAYPELYQTYKMECFAKCSIISIWQGSQFVSDTLM